MKTRHLALLLSLALVTLAQAEDKPAPLKLADDRVLVGWKILSQTATTVFVKYDGGGATVSKKLLPPELLAKYPIDEEKAKIEAAKLAEAERIGQALREKTEAKQAEEHAKVFAEYQARIARDNAERKIYREREEAALARAAEARKQHDLYDANGIALINPRTSQNDAIEAAVSDRADDYFRIERQHGDSSTHINSVKVSLNEVRAVPGWSGRFEVTGRAAYEYNTPIFGRTSASGIGYFTATVETEGRQKPEVTSFEEQRIRPR